MRVLLMSVLLLALSGCSWFTSGGTPSEAKINFAIQTGVSLFVAESPDKCPRAIEVTNVVALTLRNDPQATAYQVIDLLKLQIDWTKLTNEQTLLVLSAIGYVEAELLTRLENGELEMNLPISITRFASLINYNVVTVCERYWSIQANGARG